MKNLATNLVCTLALMSPMSVQAQNPYDNHFIVCAYERQLCKPHMPVVQPVQRNTAGTRLIKEVTGGFTAEQVWTPDSIVYAYSNKRGGDYEDHTEMFPLKYDVATVYAYNAEKGGYDLSEKRLQAINRQGQIVSVTTNSWNGNDWMKSDRTLYDYNSAGSNTTITNELYDEAARAWVGVYRINYTYNSRGEVTVASSENWNKEAKVYMPTELEQFTYERGIVTYIMQLYNDKTATYNNNVRYIYHLNKDNVEVSEVHQNYSEGAWANSDSTYVVLNGNNQPKESYIYSWHKGLGVWRQYGHNMYGQSGIVSIALGERWNETEGVYKEATKDVLVYNKANQRTAFQGYNQVTGKLYAKARYYYEEPKIEPVKSASASSKGRPQEIINSISVLVYPIPANQSINIAMSYQAAGQISCAIYDMNGKLLKEWNDEVSGEYAKQVSVADLASGVYWLKVDSKGGMVTKKFTVAH